jgi:hypothetical protein
MSDATFRNETIAFALQQDYRTPPVLDGVSFDG